MIIKLICFLWGHKRTMKVWVPAVVTDLRLLKRDVDGYILAPNTTVDVNLSMLPPGMALQDAFFIGPSGAGWQKTPFCIRCGNSEHGVLALHRKSSLMEA